jgi:hypothetical protein
MSNNMQVCSFCRNTGKGGAEWLLQVPGEADRRVHKPCGEKAVALAPEGVKARLSPSAELRARWQAERDERDAKSFWAEKFAQAQARKSQPLAPEILQAAE